MYKDLQRTCRAIVLLIKPFVWWRSRFPRTRRYGLLKLPIISCKTQSETRANSHQTVICQSRLANSKSSLS